MAAGINYGTVSIEDDGRTENHLSRSGDTVVDFSKMESLWESALEKYIGE